MSLVISVLGALFALLVIILIGASLLSGFAKDFGKHPYFFSGLIVLTIVIFWAAP